MINVVIMEGIVAREPEKYYMPSGTEVIHFPIFVKRSYRSHGDYESDFFWCESWAPYNNRWIKEHVATGTRVVVVGQAKIERWLDGPKKRTKFMVLVQSVYPLTYKKEISIDSDQPIRDAEDSMWLRAEEGDATQINW